MKYVIIGNSAAGIGAAEGIRSVDTAGEITVISAEPFHTYSRPLISYLLLGKTTREKMKYRPDDFYEKNNCTLLAGVRAEKIDAAAKKVICSDGREVPYDKLLIGTGSTPFVPPMNGLEKVKNKFSFMTLDDALSLEAALTPKSRVLIIGGGLIGLKCAEGVSGRCASITVVDLAPTILSSILDAEGAAIVQKHLEDRGMEFYLGDSVERFEENTAALKSGAVVGFDLLVLAVGVRANTALVKDIGGDVDRGIIINEKGETSVPDVYAAGDCAQVYDVSYGSRRVLALLPIAYMEGECAGVNMAGGEREFNNAMPLNSIGFFGLHIATSGCYTGECYTSRKNGYKKLFYQDDLLKGFILIGGIKNAGIYTSLIRDRVPISSIDFGLICEQPSLLAFSREDRTAKLSKL